MWADEYGLLSKLLKLYAGLGKYENYTFVTERPFGRNYSFILTLMKVFELELEYYST